MRQNQINFDEGKNMKKEYFKIILIFIIAIFLEVIIFNITSYRTLLGNYELKTYTQPEFLSSENGRSYLKISDINTEVVTFKLELKSFNGVTEYNILYSDETTKEFFGLASKNYVESDEKSHYIPLYLSGETKSLILSMEESLYEAGIFDKIILNEKIPFQFNIIRFITVLGILLFIYALKNAKIFKEEYSKKSLKQEFILLGVLAIFFVILSLINYYSSSEPSKDENSFFKFSTNYGMYNKDFVDSLKQGKFYLDFKPSEKFLELEDPYDVQERLKLQKEIDYKWDTAYYNEKFYVYFGILPALLVFLPYNLITGEYLKVSVATFGFSILIFILLKEILLKLLNRYFEKIQFKTVVYYLIILLSGSLIFYANGMSRFYEIVIIAGLYFVLQGIWFILKSLEDNENKHLNIFFGCLCMALSVACRPTDLFASILILPYLIKLFIDYIKQFKNNRLNLIKLILAVAIPYIVIGCALMWYNYVRFENVFDFGSKYQLTINNMVELESRGASIPMGIFCNLFSIPKFIPDFPFIAHSNDIATFYGYYYIENMIGGLFAIAPICLAIFFIFKFNKKIKNKELKIVVNSLIIIGIFIAIISTAMAGSNQRYLIDYAWMLVLAGILIFAGFYELLESVEAKKIIRIILCAIMIYTVIIGICSGILSEGEHMKWYSAKEYYKTKYSICFWE